MTQYAVILGTFEGAPEKASPFVERFDAIKDDLALIDVVAVSREGEGEPTVEHRGASKGKTVGTGAVVGGLIGLLAGPAGVALGAAAGAAAGGAIKGLSHVGIPKAMLDQVETGLAANSSAVLVVMEAERSDVIVNDLRDAGAKIITHTAERENLELMAPPGQAFSEK
jgi:uncharacterized membrane protein